VDTGNFLFDGDGRLADGVSMDTSLAYDDSNALECKAIHHVNRVVFIEQKSLRGENS
jgi:hypothetical protein